jgi:CRP-like cAMP-binding protein
MVSGTENGAEAIRNISELWLPLTDEQRKLLTDNVTIRRYRKNDIIYHENQTPTHLFCLLKGKVKIYKEGVGGRQQIVRMAKLKELFGYRAGLANTKYITEAAAFEDTTVCLIPITVVRQLIAESHQIALFFIQHLALLLGRADEHIVSLTQKHLRGRLAEAILRMKDNFGTEEDGRTLAIAPSREDLANLSNMTTSNAIRTLSSFISEGWIATDGRKIIILNEQQLRQISRMG